MKKISAALASLIFALFLSACGGKDETSTYILSNNGIISEITYFHKGDKVSKQTAKNVLSYASIGAQNKEQVQQMLDPLVTQFKNIDGITHSAQYKDDRMVETLEIDFTKLDFNKAKALPGMAITGDTKNGVSLKESEKILTASGFKKK